MCHCVHLGDTDSALLLAGPGDTELQQPPHCCSARFWVTLNTEFVLFFLVSLLSLISCAWHLCTL